MPLAIATELVQGLGKPAQFTGHLCTLTRGVFLAGHARVCRVDTLSTVYLELNEPLLVLGKCVERFPLPPNFAPIPSRQCKFVMEHSLGRNSFILDARHGSRMADDGREKREKRRDER